MRNMCKVLAALIAVLTVLSAFSGCSAQSSASAVYTTAEVTKAPLTEELTEAESIADDSAATESKSESESGDSEIITENTERFKNVYNEYAENLRSKTPVLINEFYVEAVYNAENGMDNDSLEHEKETELLMIFNEGLAEFVNIMNSSEASYSEYDYWENKLKAIYEEQVEELKSNCVSSGGEDFEY